MTKLCSLAVLVYNKLVKDRIPTELLAEYALNSNVISLGQTLRHPHPWFGPKAAHDWHCLAAVHHRVHRRQLERIVEKLRKAPPTER